VWFLLLIIINIFCLDTECSRPKIAKGQQSPDKLLSSPPMSPTESLSMTSSLKKHSPPNVTVIHPSANHPMFSYLCHATGNIAAMASGYMSQPNYPPGVFPSMEMAPTATAAAAAASLMNPFVFSQLLRQGFSPAVSAIENNATLPPGSIYSRTAHRFPPYSLPLTSTPLPQVSAAASLLSRGSSNNPSEDIKNLLNTLSRIKGEV